MGSDILCFMAIVSLLILFKICFIAYKRGKSNIVFWGLPFAILAISLTDTARAQSKVPLEIAAIEIAAISQDTLIAIAQICLLGSFIHVFKIAADNRTFNGKPAVNGIQILGRLVTAGFAGVIADIITRWLLHAPSIVGLGFGMAIASGGGKAVLDSINKFVENIASRVLSGVKNKETKL